MNIPKIRFNGFEEEWQENKLCDIARITMGQSPNSENYTNDSNDTLLIQGNADLNNGKVIPRLFTKQVTKTCDKNDIIMTVRAPVGDIAISDYNACIGRGVCSIKSSKFVYHYLDYLKMKDYWKKVSKGSTIDSITSDDIKSLLIKIPNKKEEEKIIKTIDLINKKIELQTKKIEDLKLFNEKIIRNLISNQNDTNYSFSELFYFKYGDGNTNPSNNGDYPVYGANGIIGGYDKYNAENCSIIGHMGAYAGTVLWENKKCFVTYNGTIAKSKNENILDNKFGYYILLSKNLPKICAGSGMPFLSYDKLNTINAFVPSIIEQKNILKKLDLIDEKLNLEQKKLRNLLLLKKGLMQNMFV